MTAAGRAVVWIGRPARGEGEGVSVDGVRAWLIGEGPRPSPAPAPRGAAPCSGPPPSAWPRDAALVVQGWEPWAGDLPAVLARRPDLRVLALPGRPWAWEWPEYAPCDGPALGRAGTAMVRGAALTVWPDAAARERFARLGPPGGSPRAGMVEPEPSILGGTVEPLADPALAAIPYMVAAGPIEARANTLLLLHLWRSQLEDGAGPHRPPWPKLVLAGARGRQAEEITPLLDWNATLRHHVVEAPGLSAQAMRHLLHHAAGLLAPDFVPLTPALARDAAALGIPVLAADTPDAPGGTDVARLHPLDGSGWRAAITAVADPAGRQRAAGLAPADAPRWADWCARIETHARAMP